MKLDKWGRVNLILAGLIVLGMAIILFKVMNQKSQWVTVEVLGSGAQGWSGPGQQQPPSWLVDSVKKGSQELSLAGKPIAEVVDIRSYEEGNNKIVFLKVKLAVSKDEKRNIYKFKQKNLEVGSLVDLSLDQTRFYGNITWIGEEEKSDEKYFRVRVKLYRKRPFLADSINVGDKSIGEYEGQVQAEVMGKKVDLAETAAVGSGGIIAGRDPLLRDIELDLKLNVVDRGGVIYFANYQPVKIGNKLWIPMKDYNLYEAEVMDVREDS